MNEQISNELDKEVVEDVSAEDLAQEQHPPQERPVEKPVEVPDEKPTEKPGEPPQETPVENPPEIPQPPSEAPVDVPDQPARAEAELERDEVALDKLQQIIEGALLALGKPLPIERLESLFLDHERPDRKTFEAALAAIAENCAERGYELKKVASGYRFQVKQDVAPWVARLWEEKPQRYSRALMETLSIIAYRQPITRGDIEKIRGVAVSTQIVQTLLEHEWIRVVGHRDVPGRPAMYATTKQFLDYFNLESLDQLPPLSEIRDLEEINRGLSLEEEKPAGRIIEFPDPEPGEDEVAEDEEAAAAAAIGTRPISEILSEVDARLMQERGATSAEEEGEEVLTTEADFDAAEAAAPAEQHSLLEEEAATSSSEETNTGADDPASPAADAGPPEQS